MRYRVAVEDIESDHYVAWVLDLFGCFGAAQSREEAIAGVPSRIAGYYAWVAGHDPAMPSPAGPFEVEVVEVFEAYASDESPDYLVNAFFEDDRRPLSYWDIVTGLKLLAWTRQDLMDVLASLSPRDFAQQLYEPVEGGAPQTIAAIGEHVARAENWYFDQLDLAVEWSTLPGDVVGKLEAVRANTRIQLVKLVGEGRITESCGECWSARKVLRRTLWHERDHTQHIAGLAARLR
jgi:hypothetical protein